MILKKRDILQESENPKFKKGCLMLNFKSKIKNWQEVLRIIDPNDLYTKEEDYGYEKDPHVTIFFGFEPEVTSKDIKELLENLTQFIKLRLTGISIFEGKEDQAYDVVKFTVESDDLNKIHEMCKELPNELTYNTYQPHMTLAYVKKGSGKKYIKKFDKPFYMEGNTLVFSTPDKHKTEWKIKKKYKYDIPLNENKK